MNADFLPVELNNEINNYKNGAEHFDNFQYVLEEIKNMEYKTEKNQSVRFIGPEHDYKNRRATSYFLKPKRNILDKEVLNVLMTEDNTGLYDLYNDKKVRGINVFLMGMGGY